MSKVWVNTLESLSGKVVNVDDIVDLAQVEGEVASGLEAALLHADEKYTEVFELTQDGTGFLDREAQLVFTNGASPKIEVKPKTTASTWSYYFLGKKVEVAGALTYTLKPSDYDKGFYLSLNAAGEFVNTGQYPDFKGTALCVYALFDSRVNKFIIQGEERHSASRDTTWHYTNHRDVGMVIRQLGALSWVADDATKVGIQLTSTIVADEDLEHTILHSVSGLEPFKQILEGSATVVRIPTLYLQNAKLTELESAQVPWVSTALKYNSGSAGLVDVPTGKYVNYFLVATHCQYAPIKLIAGRQAFDLPEETGTEKLEGLGLNLPELALLYRIVILRDNSVTQAGKCKLIAVERASVRKTFEGQVGEGGDSLPTHPALLGRNSPNQHTIEAITGLDTALAGKAASTHTHTWTQVTGKPAEATRWPTQSEIAGLTAALTNPATTWSQVANKPVTATRWPTTGEVSGLAVAFAQTADRLHGHTWADIVNPPETATRWQTSAELKAALGISNVSVSGVYTGFLASETVYPVGYTAVAWYSYNNPKIGTTNSHVTMFINDDAGYLHIPFTASSFPKYKGAAVQGTWAYRGYVGRLGGSADFAIFQRIL